MTPSFLERFAAGITRWAERWFPDSYLFAALAVAVVGIGALSVGVSAHSIAQAFGDGFWSLIPFTMQMAIVVISGYVVAASPPAEKLIDWLAKLPKSEKSAVAYTALFAILCSVLNWALSLVFGGLYVRALAGRQDLRVDYRAAGAAGYLGLGATWALGLSSSAAQLQANPASIPASLLPITGVIPFRETIFLPQSLLMLTVLTVVSVVIAYLSAPGRDRAVTASELGISLDDLNSATKSEIKNSVSRPSEWLEQSPILTLLLVGLGLAWLVFEFTTKDPLTAISNLNTYNFLFLIVGMLLCWRPKLFLNLVHRAVPSVTGILIQFPIYGSIAAILTQAKNGGGQALSHFISNFFVSISTHGTYSALMGIYSAILGFFVPSGGGKWVIEAPYLMQAANELHVHLGWTVMVYNAAEALPNLINPFFMIALIGVLGLKARDIVGYTVTQLVVHAPLVILLLWGLGETLAYHPPVMPQPSHQNVEAQIRSALNEWPISIGKGDAAAACDLFAKDTVLSFPRQPDRGYDETCQRLTRMIGSKAIRYDAPEIEEIRVRGDLAFVRLIWTAHEQDADQEEVTRERGLDVFERQKDGQWRIRVSQAYPITPRSASPKE